MADAHAHDDHHDAHDDHAHHGPDPYIVYPSAKNASSGFNTVLAAIIFIAMLVVAVGLVKSFG